MPGLSTLIATARRVPSGSSYDTLVDLGHGGGGHRRPDFGKQVVHGLSERRGNRRARRLHRKGRHAVLQALQVGRQLPPDQIGACSKELAGLDVARPEPGQRRREWRLSAGSAPCVRPPEWCRQPVRHAQGKGHRHARRRKFHAIFGQDEPGAGKPQYVGNRVRHHRSHARRSRHPQCRRGHRITVWSAKWIFSMPVRVSMPSLPDSAVTVKPLPDAASL